MASHSSILAWNIPWTEEPGGLQSMGSPRFGHSMSMHIKRGERGNLEDTCRTFIQPTGAIPLCLLPNSGSTKLLESSVQGSRDHPNFYTKLC